MNTLRIFFMLRKCIKELESSLSFLIFLVHNREIFEMNIICTFFSHFSCLDLVVA
jgi:hypothetical protein